MCIVNMTVLGLPTPLEAIAVTLGLVYRTVLDDAQSISLDTMDPMKPRS